MEIIGFSALLFLAVLLITWSANGAENASLKEKCMQALLDKPDMSGKELFDLLFK